jgi:UDP-N-acetylmuramyl pentapeptide phosphotransferase/UDP-N-acetylglucosamine-1-phosphate transferase
MLYLLLFSPLIFAYILILFCKKNQLLMNLSGDIHQGLVTKKKTPLIGGIIALFSFFQLKFYDMDLFFFYSLAIFMLGFFSDIKKLNSPFLRFILQLIIVTLCIYGLDIVLVSTRIIFLDHLLSNHLFAIFFTSYCVLIIINGTNFIDGINSLAIGYYIIISAALLFLQNNGLIVSLNFNISLFIFSLIILYFLNLSGKLYLGDAGAYFLGFLFGIELIDFYLNNLKISPFFIILLLWYPAFENLFSIIRKINFRKSPSKPDTNHLHQLIFISLRKKKYSTFKANNLTGILLNTYNAIVIAFALINPSHTQTQILLIIVNLLLYIFVYINLYRYNNKKT